MVYELDSLFYTNPQDYELNVHIFTSFGRRVIEKWVKGSSHVNVYAMTHNGKHKNFLGQKKCTFFCVKSAKNQEYSTVDQMTGRSKHLSPWEMQQGSDVDFLVVIIFLSTWTRQNQLV